MSKTKWTKPVEEIVEMAVGWVMERGHSFDDRMGYLLAQQFYTGVDLKRASRKLQKLLDTAVGRAVAEKRAAERDEYEQMAAALRAEGWEYVSDPTGIDAGLWMHTPTYTSVNRLGGFFRSWEEATQVTFKSATRQHIKSAANSRSQVQGG